MLLRSTFITLLRDIKAFNNTALTDHLRAYFTGSHAAYTLTMREKFKRLLSLTYQLDVYFALVHDSPPILHRREIGVDLPCSFALWNAYSLEIFAKRQLEEPPGRSGFKISEMASSASPFSPPHFLVEDVILGLCSLLQAIWVHTQSLPSKTTAYLGHSLQRILLIETLDTWKDELEKISTLSNSRSVNCDATKHLFLAYRGDDDSVTASLALTTTLVQDGLVLYYYLKLYHYAGLTASQDTGLRSQVKISSTETGQSSKYGREALICALQMLKLINLIRISGASINPLISHVLRMGVNVTRECISCQTCECPLKNCQYTTETDLQRWTETGGPISIDGTPVCICKLDIWTEMFEKAIRDEKRWRISE